ncbi:MAG: adenylate/guanylate cyclase domain-containing protein [Chitinophagaceae bacterium]
MKCIRKNWLFNIKEILNITLLWVLFTLFYVFIKFNDIPDSQLLSIYGVNYGLNKSTIYKISFFIGFPLGIILGLLYTFIYPLLYRKLNLWAIILVRVFVFSTIAILIFIAFDGISHFNELASRNAVSFFIYMVLTEIFVGLMVLLKRNLGRNYFVNTIINTYHTPKEEHRVFMFLDMEDSTRTVEQMGHLNFSKYIQDCFYDLSDIVLRHGGDIYQFVGDEAVITWKPYKGFEYENCIKMYYDYMDFLDRKSYYYLTKYGYKPLFKCAIHSGRVSTALVGDYKKEIAYHGDVLNLCARLQSVCKQNNSYILVSDRFFDNLQIESKTYTATPILLNNLKGIDKEQYAFSITRN